MKPIFLTVIAALLASAFTACDYQGNYTFKVKNETGEPVRFEFVNQGYDAYAHKNQNQVDVLPAEEKTIRIVAAPLNSPAHDCMREHGPDYFGNLEFEIYLNDVKIEKELWHGDHWVFRKLAKWEGEYTMTISDQLLAD